MAGINQRHRSNGVGGVNLAGFRVRHLLAVAVVGGDQGFAAYFVQRFHNSLYALVQTLGGLDGSVHLTGMANHVAVGVVAHDQVVFAALDGFDQLVGYFRRAHFRLQVVGGDFRGWHQDAVFAFKRSFQAAIEEEGHVGVLLGFGNAQLGFALAGHVFAKAVGQLLGRIGAGGFDVCGVFGEQDRKSVV